MENKQSQSGVGFLGLLTLVFIALKLMGYIGCEILTDGSCLQDIFMLRADFIRKGLQFPINRFFYGTVQPLCHFVQRLEELDSQEMTEKDADHQKGRADEESGKS